MYFKKEIPQEKIDRYLQDRMQAHLGMFPSHMSYLGQYENAVDIIFNHFVETNNNIDLVVNPFLYMIRHSVELGLKVNVNYLEKYSKHMTSNRIKHSHNLTNLSVEFEKHFTLLNAKYNFDNIINKQFTEMYDKLMRLIKQLGEDDSSFRYAQDIKGNIIFPGAEKRNIIEMKGLYDESIKLLAYTADAISPYTDYEDMLQLAPQFTSGVGYILMRFPNFQKNFVADAMNEKDAYEKLDALKWRDLKEEIDVVILEIGKECFLVPQKTEEKN
jgi:hypothetical protein